MNVEMPELLIGVVAALSEPPTAETAGEFTAGKIGVVALISLMAAQEAESGAATRAAENQAMAELLRRAVEQGWPGAPDPHLLGGDEHADLTLSGLDRRNAVLKSALIDLHEAVEAAPGPQSRNREAQILKLLRDAAQARQVHLPGAPSG